MSSASSSSDHPPPPRPPFPPPPSPRLVLPGHLPQAVRDARRDVRHHARPRVRVLLALHDARAANHSGADVPARVRRRGETLVRVTRRSSDCTRPPPSPRTRLRGHRHRPRGGRRLDDEEATEEVSTLKRTTTRRRRRRFRPRSGALRPRSGARRRFVDVNFRLQQASILFHAVILGTSSATSSFRPPRSTAATCAPARRSSRRPDV